jgi:hypothetical protein
MRVTPAIILRAHRIEPPRELRRLRMSGGRTVASRAGGSVECASGGF